ncbi:uncharacterized protein [Choristoneura fumiferana]|uniref:uncharacterized protein n=1 Tax=Choristoneura fumiferana TaxID=7141 RepID=UPI003D156306
MEQDVPNDEALPPPPAPLPSASLPPPPIEIEKEFILAFESLPELWDKTHTFYINKYKRNDALRKLLNIYIKIKPGATIEDVKKKINVLRSNYRRELKKIISSRRSGSSTYDLYRPKSWTFEYLKFLDKFEQPVPVDRASDDNQNEAESDQAQKEQEVAATISSFVAAPQPPARPPPLSSKKSVLKTQNELLERACNYLSEPQVSGARSIAFDWAETLERLTPTQRLYAKKAINDVLFEAELGNLHRYSVQINVTSTPSPAPSPFCPFPPESSYLPTHTQHLSSTSKALSQLLPHNLPTISKPQSQLLPRILPTTSKPKPELHPHNHPSTFKPLSHLPRILPTTSKPKPELLLHNHQSIFKPLSQHNHASTPKPKPELLPHNHQSIFKPLSQHNHASTPKPKPQLPHNLRSTLFTFRPHLLCLKTANIQLVRYSLNLKRNNNMMIKLVT